MKVSIVNSAGDSFCWYYATETFYGGNYASDNVCRIFAGFKVVLPIAGMLVNLSVAIMQLEVSAAHMQGNSFCNKYVDDNFYCSYADGSLCG